MDGDGLGLVFAPVVGWGVNRVAGFDAGFQGVLGVGVVGEEEDFGSAVFGADRILCCGDGFGKLGGEEGKHSGGEMMGRDGLWVRREMESLWRLLLMTINGEIGVVARPLEDVCIYDTRLIDLYLKLTKLSEHFMYIGA